MTFALVTCSGISNTGKLTTQAALTLLQRRPGQYVWMHARQSAAMLELDIGDVDQVIVIDGCKDCCAKKKLSASRLAPHCHIIATELGIKKNGMGEVQYDEIEKVIRAVINNGVTKSMDAPRYKRLEIEWKHFAVGDATCERCGNTSDALHEAVEELRHALTPAAVKINLTETLLDKTRIAESNEIRMNGMLLEDILAAGVVSTDCSSCSTLAGESTCCRAIEVGNERSENIPAELIKKAAYLALGVTSQENRGTCNLDSKCER